ncbi:uncharacterized protein UHOD_11806 [Ustilago sp. UG-2017b]|nr:uncharacterized protein UHOD_11806 [Ustilago sp. UG-2017b]
MKLSGMFRIGFVAAIVTALILLPSCIAVEVSDRAGTSTSHPDPPIEPPRSVFDIENYIKSLNPKQITDLHPTTLDNLAQLYGHVPIYRQDPISHRIPLYSFGTSVPVVEQALKDYGSVGIVDVSNNKAELIRLDKGFLYSDVFAGDGKSAAIQLFKLDPDLHRLSWRVSKIKPPHSEEIENLPHFDGKPILQGSEDFRFMLRVANTPPYQFYYLQEQMKPILVYPASKNLFSNPDHDEKQKILRAVNGYPADKQKYGERVASMIWGKLDLLGGDTEGRVKSSIPMKDYPRFKYDAPKTDMVRALQEHGRFRVYTNFGGDKVAYKVKLKNPGNTGKLMNVSVKPLTLVERLQEAIHRPRIRLPW